MTSADRASLRKELRRRRQALAPDQQHIAAHRLMRQVVTQDFFRRAGNVAFYCASDGEIDPLAILFRALAMKKRCCLPVLSPHRPGRVCFAPFEASTPLQPNRWGILEPECQVQHHISTLALDLVFVPLVGFDAHCNRIGMGKGFYDRTFAGRTRSGVHRPRMIGLAHECQRVAAIPMAQWDVPLDGVVTDRGLYLPD